jgi:hypothetical protein
MMCRIPRTLWPARGSSVWTGEEGPCSPLIPVLYCGVLCGAGAGAVSGFGAVTVYLLWYRFVYLRKSQKEREEATDAFGQSGDGDPGDREPLTQPQSAAPAAMVAGAAGYHNVDLKE